MFKNKNLSNSVLGASRYTAYYQRGNININPSTSPTMVSCQQGALVKWWHRACGSKRLMNDLVYEPLTLWEGNPHLTLLG